MASPLLSVDGVVKTYGPVTALGGVSLQFRSGEIHAVLGENGAGKSTLMGVLSGFVVPDRGSVLLEGSPFPVGKPQTARQLGIRIVHQHFMLAPRLSVGENLALAELQTPWSMLEKKVGSVPAAALATRLGWDLPDSPDTGSLPVGVRQRIEILKALAGTPRLLVLDEPTAVLTQEETQEVFGILRNLAESGIAIVLIAHKLEEVMEIADRITVLRNGQLAGSAPARELDRETLERWMVGETIQPLGRGAANQGPTVLRVDRLDVSGDEGNRAVKGATLEVRSGEVLGIGGVDGNGQVELAEAIVGIRQPASGTIAKPDHVAYIPQDRQTDGLALTLSVQDNLFLGRTPSGVAAGPMLSLKRIRETAARLVREYDVRIASLSQSVAALSGGNQQKLVIARELEKKPDLIVAVNPTRGLDIKAAAAVTGQILQRAAAGSAVLLLSTDRDELSAVANRVLTMSHGIVEAKT